MEYRGARERSLMDYLGYPCPSCPLDRFVSCTDTETAFKTLVNGKLELGCMEFVAWIKTPITKGLRDI